MKTLFTEKKEFPEENCPVHDAISIMNNQLGDLIFRHVREVSSASYGTQKKSHEIRLDGEISEDQTKIDAYLHQTLLDETFEIDLREIVETIDEKYGY